MKEGVEYIMARGSNQHYASDNGKDVHLCVKS